MLPSDNDQLLSWSQLETARQERDAALQGEATANRLLEHHRARADQAEREFAQATIDMANEMAKVKRLRESLAEHLAGRRAARELRKERYLPLPCPNCARIRLLYSPINGQLRCEKCGADTETLVSFAEELLKEKS
ncbi:MAG TPA: hypothetical protein VJA25_02120 [Dehalococcoidia bacterium]|nr:hypothetical protein [Dehalococcoidia bacterium]